MMRHASPMVEPVVTQVHVPPGMRGPEPVSFEVRCFVVADAGGVVLIDTCTPGSIEAIGAPLTKVGAAWSDVTDIVLTHSHFDHTGGLTESAELASGVTLWAGAQDAPEIPTVGGRAARPLAESDRVGNMRVLHTPRAYAWSRQPSARRGLDPLHRQPRWQRGRRAHIRAISLHRGPGTFKAVSAARRRSPA